MDKLTALLITAFLIVCVLSITRCEIQSRRMIMSLAEGGVDPVLASCGIEGGQGQTAVCIARISQVQTDDHSTPTTISGATFEMSDGPGVAVGRK